MAVIHCQLWEWITAPWSESELAKCLKRADELALMSGWGSEAPRVVRVGL